MALTFENLKDGTEEQKPKTLDKVVALLQERCDDLYQWYASAVKDTYHKGNAVIVTIKDNTGEIVGASFSILYNGDAAHPPVAIIRYEAFPPDAGGAQLLNASKKAIGEILGEKARIFIEGRAPQRKLYENRGFRLIRYDHTNSSDPVKNVEWSEGSADYKWMVYGDTPPTLKEMEAAIHLERVFEVGANCPEYINPALTIDQQVQRPARGEWGVDKYIAHAQEWLSRTI